MMESQINVHLEQFDGPLGLLLHLIQREEMSISELDITKITSEYLSYLSKLHELNFDVAGDYLFMAASLIHMKSEYSVNYGEEEKRILTAQEGPLITKTMLIEKLEELKRMQDLSKKFWEKSLKRDEDIFVKPKVNRKALQDSILTPMDLDELTNSMLDLLGRQRRKYTAVRRDRLSIKEKLTSLKERLEVGSKTTLRDLIDFSKGRDDVVITFISLLELARLNKLEIFQEEDQGEIKVNVVSALNDLDIESANGFDDEEESEESNITNEEISENENQEFV